MGLGNSNYDFPNLRKNIFLKIKIPPPSKDGIECFQKMAYG
jgi:hypothetical protein